MDIEDPKEYRWETGYERTWEAITEDNSGLIEISVQEMIQKARRKKHLERAGMKSKLGMMRHLFIILDMSETMKLQDMKPSRLLCVLNLLENFVQEFFHLNPISQIGIITTKNKRADIVSELTGKFSYSKKSNLLLNLSILKHFTRSIPLIFENFAFNCNPGFIYKNKFTEFQVIQNLMLINSKSWLESLEE